MIRTSAKYASIAVGGVLAVIVLALLVGFWMLTRGPVAVDAAGPAIKSTFADAFAPLRIEFIDPTLVWSGENRAFQFRVDQVEIFDAEDNLVADVPRAEIGISADALMRGIIAPSRIEFIGATALMIRRRDGGLQLGLSTPEGGATDSDTNDEIEPLGIVQSILELLLQPPDRSTRAGYLSEFIIRDSTLRYFDAPTSSFWRAPNGFLSFGRGAHGLSLRLDADVEVGGRKWGLDASGNFDPVTSRGDLEGQFSDFNPSHIASAVPALASLAGIDLPIQGEVALGFTGAGQITSADLSVVVGSGEFGLPGFFDEPVPVDSAGFVGEFRPQDQSAEIRHLTYRAGDNSADISGSIRVETAEDDPLLPIAFDFDVVAENLSIFMTSLQDRPIVYDRAELTGRLDEPARTLSISSFHGITQGGEINMTARASDATGQIEFYANGTASDIPSSEILAYWPMGRVLGARQWIGNNLRAGMVRTANFEIDAPPGTFAEPFLPNETIEVNFTFDGAEASFVTGLPVMTDASGSGTLFADQFNVDVDSGRIGDVVIHSGSLVVDQMHIRGTTGVIDAEAEGPIEQVLRILDSGPFDYPTRYGIDPSAVSGTGRGTLHLELPMLSRPPRDRIDFSSHAVVRGLAVPEVGPNMDLTDGSVTLDLSRAGLRASGTAALNGVPVDLSWSENFGDRESPSSFSLAGTLNDSDRIRLGMDFGAAVSGPIDVEIETRGRGRLMREVGIRADLIAATVLIPNTDWHKPAGEIGAARLRLMFPEDGGFEVRDLLFAGDRVLIRGGFALGANGRLESADLERVRLDGLVDVSVDAARDDQGALSIELDGDYFNAAPFMQRFTRAEDQGPGLPFSVEGSLNRLTMLKDVEVNDIDLYLYNDGARIIEMDLAGAFAAGGAIRANLIPRTDGTRDFVATTTNAGELLNGLVGFDYISGGNLVLDVVVRDSGDALAEEDAPDASPDTESLTGLDPVPAEEPHVAAPREPTRGILTINRFRVVGAPVLAQLLSLGSLQGLADTLNGDGIAFSTLELPFYADGGVLGFESGNAHGSALGITLDGTIDRDRGQTNLTGSLVPAYDINSFLGNVPVFGELFVNREGEGLIAFNYGIIGPTNDPQVYVNPLSALTPGLFRRIFSGNPPAQPAPPRAEAETETAPAPEELDTDDVVEPEPQPYPN